MLRQMRYFIAVVDAGSFSEAAERCHISQSAVSQQIRALEDELDVALLARRGRRFELTPAGRWFYQQAKRQVAEIDSVVREARRIGSGKHQQLRVGVLAGFSRRTVEAAVGDFVATHPNVRVTLYTGTHEDIFKRTVNGQLDMVINDQRRALADHFVNFELGEQPLFALLRQDHPLSKSPSLALDDLRDARCLVVAPEGQRDAETDYWRGVMNHSGDLLFMDSAEDAALNAVAGVGWLPCDRDQPTAPGMARVPLARGGAPLTRRMFAFWLEANDSPLQWELADSLSRHFR